MDTYPTHQSDPAFLALRDHLAQHLRSALPQPIGSAADDSESPSDHALACRDAAALARIESLAPADPAEAALAAQHVIAGAHANHCVYLFKQHAPASDQAIILRKQIVGLLREARRSLSLLTSLQEQRYKQGVAAMASRETFAHPGGDQDAGGDFTNPAGNTAAPPLPEKARPAPPRRSPPALRLIQGGLAS